MIGTIREKALKIKTVSKLNTEKSHHTRPVLIFAMSWMRGITLSLDLLSVGYPSQTHSIIGPV